jgi:hypothetical protein
MFIATNRKMTGEYPAGSTSCAESTGELKSGSRNMWFILFTNTMIDWGFVAGAFVPCTFSSPPKRRVSDHQC